ncbi:MAG: SUMF1/EgtB/PvdO family nonheme iron enzyme [Kouleothrix sp.]|nr:SUMF1/EgtB/PvdO family nonheme iron enzyme [Kouleothrix sp.]
MSDLATQLDFLRALRDAAPDAAARAMFEQLIAEKEAAAPPAARGHTQHISGYATIAAAVAGDVHGDLYIVGERTHSARQLLAGYLRWLASQCGLLPLRGVREQKTATDVLQIDLDQVYTQLATTELAEREVFEGADLQQFDAQSYLAQHTGAQLLPAQQRQAVRAQRREPGDQLTAVDTDLDSDGPLGLPGATRLAGRALETLALDDVRRRAQDADRLVFSGPQLVTEAIAASPRLVLLGEPGSGKSTALRYLALTLARAGLDDTLDVNSQLHGWQTLGLNGQLIPLFMPLLPLARRLAALNGHNGSAADLWAAIDAHLNDHGATRDVVAAVRAELARGHVLLLLDGLDEVAGGDSRRQVVAAVQAFAAEQPRCRIVVACRVRAYDGEQNQQWQLAGWPTATLADWTPGQVQAFIQAWYAAAAAASRMPPARRDARVAALQRAVVERDDLKRLSVRPLLLTIMALVHLNDGRLPEDRVSLYARCLDILLVQWEIAGRDETDYGSLMHYIGLPDADVKTLRPLLARTAYAAHEAAAPGDVGRLRRSDLRELVADELERLKHPNPHEGARRFLEYTDVRAGLLQASDAGDAYAFPHQTFQEYLAGLELIRGVGFVDRIMERRGDDRWRVPIVLGIGHLVSEGALAMPYQLLSRLLRTGKRDLAQRQRDSIFAAELAADVGWDRLERSGDEFTALRGELAQALAGVVEGTELPAAERVHAGVRLGQLGDPRPGACGLPPAMVELPGASVVLGIPAAQTEHVRALWLTYWQERGEGQAERYADVFAKRETNATEAPLQLPAFAIGRTPITNAQYQRFLDDGGYDPAKPWWDAAARDWLARDDAATEGLQEWQRRTHKDQPEWWDNEQFGRDRPNHPVVGVSWYEATAFCRWLTQNQVYNPDKSIYTLPSEAEWEYAARGVERRPYPWGEPQPDGERANFNQIYKGTTAVGCFSAGATPEGVLDLAGNVWEWTRSIYRPYPYEPDDGREAPDDPSKELFTLRGGGWFDLSIYLRASGRNDLTPDYHYDVVGFRLARYRTNSR